MARTHEDPELGNEVAIAIGAVMEGTILLWVYDRSLVDLEQHLRSGMKLLLEGVQAK